MIKAALLDERGVYLRIVELASEADLTDRHVPTITSCDLPAGRYRWITDNRKRPSGEPMNPHGGAFWPLAWLKLVGLDAAPDDGGLLPLLEARKNGVGGGVS